jgi:Raf kinase inhibitor-like YbhB/YbcL family protein
MRQHRVGLLALTILCTASISTGWLQAEEKTTFSLKSAAFDHGGEIPTTYTCEGQDVAPPLEWEGVPAQARSLVLIVDDPDAPDPHAPRMTWVHWVLYNIPPDAQGLPENAASEALPPGTGEGLNDWKRTGYGGPCPPIGRHRYFFKFYALDTVLEGLNNPTKKQVENAIQGHIIAQTKMIGTYEKSE